MPTSSLPIFQNYCACSCSCHPIARQRLSDVGVTLPCCLMDDIRELLSQPAARYECLDEKKHIAMSHLHFENHVARIFLSSLKIPRMKNKRKRGFVFWNLGVALPQDTELGASA